MAADRARRGAPPIVVRAHEHIPLTQMGRAVRSVIVRTASAVAAVSDFTAERFNEGLPHPVATRVYNSIDHARFDPARVSPAPVREELGHRARTRALIGQIAQITAWKGQDTADPRARRAARRRHRRAPAAGRPDRLRGQGRALRQPRLPARRSKSWSTSSRPARRPLPGQRGDVPEIMRALDLTLLPSWEEPFGLVTVESMALGTPPLVSANGAGPELVDDGVSGRLLPPEQPERVGRRRARAARGPRARCGAWPRRGPAAAAPFRDDVHAARDAGRLRARDRRAAPGAHRRRWPPRATSDRADGGADLAPAAPAARGAGRRQRPRLGSCWSAAPRRSSSGSRSRSRSRRRARSCSSCSWCALPVRPRLGHRPRVRPVAAGAGPAPRVRPDHGLVEQRPAVAGAVPRDGALAAIELAARARADQHQARCCCWRRPASRSGCRWASWPARARRCTPSSRTRPASAAPCWDRRARALQAARCGGCCCSVVPVIAVYAIVQRASTCRRGTSSGSTPGTSTASGVSRTAKVRVFGDAQQPGRAGPAAGTVAALLPDRPHGARRSRSPAPAIVTVALSLTFVRSAWLALIAAGIAHVVVSRGRSARVVFGAGGGDRGGNPGAVAGEPRRRNDVVERFETIDNLGARRLGDDRSATSRQHAARRRRGAARPRARHGGRVDEAERESELRAPDNGYLSLMYQVGPIGFLLVMVALGYMLRRGVERRRARAPGQELRWLLFAMLDPPAGAAAAGDEFYGSHGVILWFIGGSGAGLRLPPPPGGGLGASSGRGICARRRRGARRLHVDPLQAVAHARPGEALLDHLAVALAHGPAQAGVDQQLAPARPPAPRRRPAAPCARRRRARDGAAPRRRWPPRAGRRPSPPAPSCRTARRRRAGSRRRRPAWPRSRGRARRGRAARRGSGPASRDAARAASSSGPAPATRSRALRSRSAPAARTRRAGRGCPCAPRGWRGTARPGRRRGRRRGARRARRSRAGARAPAATARRPGRAWTLPRGVDSSTVVARRCWARAHQRASRAAPPSRPARRAPGPDAAQRARRGPSTSGAPCARERELQARVDRVELVDEVEAAPRPGAGRAAASRHMDAGRPAHAGRGGGPTW